MLTGIFSPFLGKVLNICFSLIAIIALLPLFSYALLHRFTGEGEIFYSQVRVGRNRKFFDAKILHDAQR